MAEVMQPLNSKCRDGTKDGGASKETAASKAKRKRKANNGPALKSAVVDKSDVKEAVVKSDVAVGATGDARDKKTAEGIS